MKRRYNLECGGLNVGLIFHWIAFTMYCKSLISVRPDGLLRLLTLKKWTTSKPPKLWRTNVLTFPKFYLRIHFESSWSERQHCRNHSKRVLTAMLFKIAFFRKRFSFSVFLLNYYFAFLGNFSCWNLERLGNNPHIYCTEFYE